MIPGLGSRSRWIFGGKEWGVGSRKTLGVKSRESEILKICCDKGGGSRRIFEVKESGVGSLKSQGVGVGVGKSVNRLPSPG